MLMVYMNRGNDPACKYDMLKLVALILLILCGTSSAIDNPDIPNLVAEFESRARVFEGETWGETPHSSLKEGYQEFLLSELDRAYVRLTDKLRGEARRKFVVSQLQWEKYKESEFKFIDENWQPATFGSSYRVSRFEYRAVILKARIVVLLNYAQNY